MYEKATSKNLFNLGLRWGVAMKKDGNSLYVGAEDKEAINKELLEICGFTVYTVWQKNDPYIKAKGKRGKAYKTIMQACGSLPDKGAGEARAFYRWHTGQAGFDTLSEHMRDLAVITHVAEVGRGYTGYSLDQLMTFILEVAEGKAKWSQLKDRYEAALTSKEDTDYQPS